MNELLYRFYIAAIVIAFQLKRNSDSILQL